MVWTYTLRLYRDITLQQTMLDGTYAHPRAFPTRAHISRTGNGAIEATERRRVTLLLALFPTQVYEG